MIVFLYCYIFIIMDVLWFTLILSIQFSDYNYGLYFSEIMDLLLNQMLNL